MACGDYADEDNHDSESRLRFLPLRDVYSTSMGSTNVVSKKVRARKLTLIDSDCGDYNNRKQEQVQVKEEPKLDKVFRVYSRRNKSSVKAPLFGLKEEISLVSEVRVKSEPVDEGFDCDLVGFPNKKIRVSSLELIKLGVDDGVLSRLNGPRLRESRFRYSISDSKEAGSVKRNSDNRQVKKRWLQLSLRGVDPMAIVGLKCKVYWPLDEYWYKASVAGYDAESKKHYVKYDDGDEENLVLLNEQIKFHISGEEMQKLNIRDSKCMDDNVPDYNHLIGLAAMADESQELAPGEIIWAKLSGYPRWPAVIMNEASVRDQKGLNKGSGGRSVPVHFFGSHDFASIQAKQLVSFLKGLASGFHLKSKSPQFLLSLEEAKRYMNDQKLPESMLNLQRVCEGVETTNLDEDSKKDEDISNSEGLSKFHANKMLSERYDNMPRGYRPLRIDWKDLDRCNVCHMDEEYENNLFLQCDKCRMMVHARCYGEQIVDGSLWLCNLCRVGAPKFTPPCRLCPIVGGAMKPTTDGNWAHLACAIWIPETCLSDVKRMEPINGLSRINKDRWKLMCSICGVPYGACIQCSNSTCRVAYHPLCARDAGLCVEDFELDDEDHLHLINVDEDEKEQCIRLLSFCKKHKQASNHRAIADEWTGKNTCSSSYSPPPNESGCARSEPYDYSSRRGRKEPGAAASVKRLFLENIPYLVGGYCLHDSMNHVSEKDKIVIGSKLSSGMQNRTSNQGSSISICSMADKYKYMRETFRKRLAFGKSRIHGFGIFTKQPHKAGDMVIEYTGELVRAPVADRREHFIYNSLVGAGTYMFRIDDERVIDATRAGSIAHLINHSCEPNCYSRVITVSGDKHIIIFAKRDIQQWEELTYDYRFVSIDEQLKCSCGSERCRGVVNDTEAEELSAKLCVPRSELIDWRAKYHQ